MFNSMGRFFLGFSVFVVIFSVGIKAGFAQPNPTPDALAKTMVSSIAAKNQQSVQALIHPQVVSYLRVTDPTMLNNITASLMALKIPPDYKIGVVSLDDLEKSGSEMAKYDKATQVLTLMGAPAYYKIPPSHLMALVVEKQKTVEVDGKKENKIVKVPLTPTPLPIGQYKGNWYIVIAVGKK
ncbi:MAG: hypothetical protein DHS20C13_00100 [Thermodesulfobacteriota bacterium]|nr:MAG: hypothetical protein DHS20C13_00100 [Thermodesulfobacteriota bacterium]